MSLRTLRFKSFFKQHGWRARRNHKPRHPERVVLIRDGVLLYGVLCDACKIIFRTGEYYIPDQASVLLAAKSGCYLCQRNNMEYSRAKWGNLEPGQPFQFSFERDWRDSSSDIILDPWSSLWGFRMHPQEESSAECYTCLFGHEMFSSAARVTLQRRQDLPAAWLNECLCGHENCRADEDSGFQPPRLISVSENLIHLVDSAVTGRYATLSYCWGPNPTHLTLTTENLDSFREEIRSEQLPQTFRDAIAFTRALGISYIWIDALCILQTGEISTEDWQNHLTLMASIYANGVVNLSASSSQDAHRGLGVPCGPADHPPVLSVRVENRHEKEQFMLVDSYISERTQAAEAIIDTRGWVAQERILSPRVIDFTAGKVYWQCVQGIASELSPYGRSYNDHYSVFMRPRNKMWVDIVEDYSERKLTNPNDKFPAIAGIASKFADRKKDKYFAGHFSSSLPGNLIWRAAYGVVKRAEDAYLAPSWSWASMAGRVEADIPSFHPGERTVAKVKKIEVGLKDPKNRFGQIISGSIVLEGPLLENQQFDYFKHQLRKTSVWWKLAMWEISFRRLLASSRTRITLDVAGDILDGRALSFFGISQTKGLVLVELDRNTYERVGIYTTDIDPSDPLLETADQRPWRKVKIV